MLMKLTTDVSTPRDLTLANAAVTTDYTTNLRNVVDKINRRSAKKTRLDVLLTERVEILGRKNPLSASLVIATKAFRGLRMGPSQLVLMWMSVQRQTGDASMTVRTWYVFKEIFKSLETFISNNSFCQSLSHLHIS